MPMKVKDISDKAVVIEVKKKCDCGCGDDETFFIIVKENMVIQKRPWKPYKLDYGDWRVQADAFDAIFGSVFKENIEMKHELEKLHAEKLLRESVPLK